MAAAVTMRVLCAGHVNWDVTFHVDQLPDPDGEVVVRQRVQAGGGSAANVAHGLTRLGTEAVLFGSVGSDDPGRLVVDDLEAAGVDCRNIKQVDGQTAVKYLIVDETGEVMVFAVPGENEAFQPADLDPDTLPEMDVLHLTSQHPDTAAALASQAVDSSVTVSFDPGRRVDARDYEETIERADVVFLNAREAEALGDTARGGGDRTVIVKRGAGGAEAWTRTGSVTHPGFDIDPVDTTGAGDAFAAGYIAAMADGHEHALEVANACGAMAARSPGAHASLSWAAIDAVIAGN